MSYRGSFYIAAKLGRPRNSLWPKRLAESFSVEKVQLFNALPELMFDLYLAVFARYDTIRYNIPSSQMGQKTKCATVRAKPLDLTYICFLNIRYRKG